MLAWFSTVAIVCGTSVGLMLVGYPLRSLLRRIKVPPAVSLMALGVAVGPALVALLPGDYLHARAVLSKAAFVVLLLRAGLGLPPEVLRAVAGPAILFAVIPVAMELAVVTALTEVFFMQDWQLAVLAGFLIAAVSPSVILPIMLNQKDVGVGGPRYIPDRIIGQTVINAFIAQTGILLMLEAIAPKPNSPEIWQILALSPLAVVGGAAVGIAAGWFLPLAPLVGSPRSDDSRVPRLRIAAWIVLALALAVYFTCSEFRLESVFATLAFGVILLRRFAWCEPVFRTELKKIWGAAEVILFVNLGSAIDLDQLVNPGLILGLLGIIGAAMGVRLVVAFLLTLRTSLVPKERRYITAANIPKATIQAVFGALPLLIFQQWRPDLVPQGQTLLIMAVLAIVSTAPVGAFLLEQWGPRGGKGSRQREMGDGHKKINELTVIAD